MKIARQHAQLVFSFFMAALMSGLMSFVISVLNLGLVDGLLLIWLKAWGSAFLVAFPAILLITPLVRRLTQAVLAPAVDPDA